MNLRFVWVYDYILTFGTGTGTGVGTGTGRSTGTGTGTGLSIGWGTATGTGYGLGTATGRSTGTACGTGTFTATGYGLDNKIKLKKKEVISNSSLDVLLERRLVVGQTLGMVDQLGPGLELVYRQDVGQVGQRAVVLEQQLDMAKKVL